MDLQCLHLPSHPAHCGLPVPASHFPSCHPAPRCPCLLPLAPAGGTGSTSTRITPTQLNHFIRVNHGLGIKQGLNPSAQQLLHSRSDVLMNFSFLICQCNSFCQNHLPVPPRDPGMFLCLVHPKEKLPEWKCCISSPAYLQGHGNRSIWRGAAVQKGGTTFLKLFQNDSIYLPSRLF